MGCGRHIRIYVGDKVKVNGSPAVVTRVVTAKDAMKEMGSSAEIKAFVKTQKAFYGDDWDKKYAKIHVKLQGGKQEWHRAEEVEVVQSRGDI